MWARAGSGRRFRSGAATPLCRGSGSGRLELSRSGSKSRPAGDDKGGGSSAVPRWVGLRPCNGGVRAPGSGFGATGPTIFTTGGVTPQRLTTAAGGNGSRGRRGRIGRALLQGCRWNHRQGRRWFREAKDGQSDRGPPEAQRCRRDLGSRRRKRVWPWDRAGARLEAAAAPVNRLSPSDALLPEARDERLAVSVIPGQLAAHRHVRTPGRRIVAERITGRESGTAVRMAAASHCVAASCRLRALAVATARAWR